MAITDNRTLLTNANAAVFDDLAGAAYGNTNTETFIFGTGSQSEKVSNAVAGFLYDFGSAGDRSGDVFYFWANCSTAGKLEPVANGGIRIRFCGATVTDWFEVYVEGSDTYSGGFKMLVADIDEARAQAVGAGPGGTNGTPPATTAIRYAGIVFDMASMISGNIDNVFVDACWRLPSGTPGILFEGQNTGSVDWTWQDGVDAGDVGDPTKAWGTIERLKNGTINLNTPVRFGADDTVTHGFSDTNETIGFEDALVPDGFYGIDVIGNSGGTTDFETGVKSGSGDDAVGAQGGSILSAGPRYYIDASDPDIDSFNLYGTTLAGAGDITVDDPAVSMISCIYLDCSSALVSNSEQLRNTIVNANTADGVAFMTTDDLGDIVYCEFQFSDGHALEITTPRIAAQTSKGNRFTGYGATGTNDAAIYNDTAGLVDISATSGASVSEHTYRNGTSASTTVTAAITISYSNFAVGTEIRVYRDSDGGQEDGIETTLADPWDASLQSGVDYTVVAIYEGYIPIRFEAENYAGDQTVNLNQQVDRNFENP